MKKLISIIFLCALAGCTSGLRTKGGTARIETTGGATAVIQQPENPKDAAKQDVDVEDESDFFVPSGATVQTKTVEAVPNGPAKTNLIVFTVPQATTVHHSHKEISHSDVGAAQKDSVGELVAKLKSAKIFVVLGILFCIGGVFLAVWPPAEAFLGGFTPGAIIAAVGLVIAVAPYLIIGNEKLLTVVVALAIAGGLAFWWVHKHGGMQAELIKLKADLDPAQTKTPSNVVTLKTPLD